MSSINPTTASVALARIRAHWRPILLITASIVLLSVFWYVSRYPQLLGYAAQEEYVVPSMAYSHQAMSVGADAPMGLRIIATTVNWLSSMKIGMTFGVLLGALLHLTLRYYPLTVGTNLYLNALKGALVGVPGGVCANCAVPVACGVTRGNGRVEVALGFLFSSPNFNPVVVMMTFTALPLAMSLTKYIILVFVILFLVPALVRGLDRTPSWQQVVAREVPASCVILSPPAGDGSERFTTVFRELARGYAEYVWMLLKPTITLMLLAGVLAATALVVVPWEALLSQATPWRLAYVSLLSVFIPVPIAMDVMFAAQLQQQGVPAGYVMLFAMTLGTYSIIPSIYLWREVSKPLSAGLFGFFLVLGWIVGLVF